MYVKRFPAIILFNKRNESTLSFSEFLNKSTFISVINNSFTFYAYYKHKRKDFLLIVFIQIHHVIFNDV